MPFSFFRTAPAFQEAHRALNAVRKTFVRYVGVVRNRSYIKQKPIKLYGVETGRSSFD